MGSWGDRLTPPGPASALRALDGHRQARPLPPRDPGTGAVPSPGGRGLPPPPGVRVLTERKGQAVLLQESHGVVPAQARELHEGRRADPVVWGWRSPCQHCLLHGAPQHPCLPHPAAHTLKSPVGVQTHTLTRAPGTRSQLLTIVNSIPVMTARHVITAKPEDQRKVKTRPRQALTRSHLLSPHLGL